MSDDNLRLPPQAIEAEQAVIGSALQNPIALEDVTEILTSDDFYNHQNAVIFKSIQRVFASGNPVDLVTVDEDLASNGESDLSGGLNYIGGIVKNTPSTGSHKTYARIVKEKSMKRGLIELCSDQINNAYNDSAATPYDLINSTAVKLESLEMNESNSHGLTISQVGLKALDSLETRFKSDSNLIGLPTGLRDLDDKLAGLCKGDLIVVGARPSMGKTAFSANLIKSCLVGGGVVQFFSMEMPAEQIYNRIWAEQSGVPLPNIRQPKLLESDQWSRLTAATKSVNDWNLIIDDQASLSVNQIRSRCRKTKRRMGALDVVVVDYLQLMSRSNDGTTAEQIGQITRALKSMAKDLDVVLVLLSQLNRSLEQRPNKRPVMSDLRDSGSIEADADIIMFLYRDEIYNEQTEYKNICEIIIAKFRNGETGTVRSIFKGAIQRFIDFANPSFK